MTIQFGPSILEHITNIVLEPVYGKVKITKTVINKGFMVLTLSTGDTVSLDSKTLTIIK